MLDFMLQYPTTRIKQKRYETLDYSYKKDVNYVSRYEYTRVITEKDTLNKIFETYDKEQIAESDNDVYYKVTFNNENRLDIIANEVYGFAIYWWVIAMANNIIDPFDIPAGTILRIPPISALYDTYNVLGTKLNKIVKTV